MHRLVLLITTAAGIAAAVVFLSRSHPAAASAQPTSPAALYPAALEPRGTLLPLDPLNRFQVTGLKGERDVAAVAAYLADPNGKVREVAGALLAANGTETAVRALLRKIRREVDPSVRENLTALVRTVRNSAATPALAEQAVDIDSGELHRICRETISALPGSGATSQVIRMAEEAGVQASPVLLYALARMRAPEAVAALSQGLESSVPAVASACAQALARQGSPAALAAQLQQLGHDPGAGFAGAIPEPWIDTVRRAEDDSLVSTCVQAALQWPGSTSAAAAIQILSLLRCEAAGRTLEERAADPSDSQRSSWSVAWQAWAKRHAAQ